MGFHPFKAIRKFAVRRHHQPEQQGSSCQTDAESYAESTDYQNALNEEATAPHIPSIAEVTVSDIQTKEDRVRLLGLTDEQAADTESGYAVQSDGSARFQTYEKQEWQQENIAITLEYLQKRAKEGTLPTDAIEEISGLPGYMTKAMMQFGLTREQLTNGSHNWVFAGEEALEYLENCKKSTEEGAFSPEMAEKEFQEIEGLSRYQIKAVMLGLSRLQVENSPHNWDETGRTIVAYLESCKNSAKNAFSPEVAQNALQEIVGLNENQIRAMTLGLTRSQVTSNSHNWAKDGWAIVEYLTSSKKKTEAGKDVFSPEVAENALQEIKELNENQIRAMTLGLTRQEVTAAGYNWRSNAYYTLRYLGQDEVGRLPDSLPIRLVLTNIKDKSEEEIRIINEAHDEGVRLGLSPMQLYIAPFGEQQLSAVRSALEVSEATPDEAFKRACPEAQKRIDAHNQLLNKVEKHKNDVVPKIFVAAGLTQDVAELIVKKLPLAESRGAIIAAGILKKREDAAKAATQNAASSSTDAPAVVTPPALLSYQERLAAETNKTIEGVIKSVREYFR